MIGHSVDDLSHNERSGLGCQLEPRSNCPITGPSGGATSRGSKIGWAAGFSFPKSSKVSLSVHSNKNNQGRKRRGGVFISGAGPKMEKKKGEGLEVQVQVEVGVTEITKSPILPTPLPTVGGWLWRWWTVGSSPRRAPTVRARRRTRRRGSVTHCGPAGPTWTLLGPADRGFTTNQTP